MTVWILFVALLIFWNTRAYRAYLKITYKTLFHEMKPTEWRDYIIDQKVRTSTGWII